MVHVVADRAQLLRQRPSLFVENIAEYHLGAFVHEMPYVRFSYAPCSARDKDDFSVKNSHAPVR
ncbi:hypothetical protein GCM10027590_23940 [Nocardiopsis nanhaiensis]